MSTSAPVTNIISPMPSIERMDVVCVEQVNNLHTRLEIASSAQYLTLANAAEHCIENLSFSPQHPDLQTAMQFNALAFTNYLKAGDIQQAVNSLAQFRRAFPQQDLLFDDYTSFVDTATALTKQHELSAYQLTTLNINPQLRAELKRTRNWSM